MIRDRINRISTEIFLIVFIIVMYIHSITTDFSLSTYILHLLAASLTAAIVDIAINYAKHRRIIKPYHAIISGLIIAIILIPVDILFSIAVPAIAMVLKHVLRIKGRNIFNPAALGLLIFAYLFSAPSVWWVSSYLIVPFGLFIAWKIRSLTTSLSFLAVYYLVLLVQGIPIGIVYSLFFFAFVMVLEPVTSAHTAKGKIVFGSAVGLLAALSGLYTPYPFLTSLLIMNPVVYLLDKKLR